MEIYSIPFHAMASVCELRLPATSLQEAQKIALPAIAEVRRIEHKYSRYREESTLSQINKASGHHPLAIDTETAELLDYAEILYQTSAGLFDITSGILRRVWNFNIASLPDQKALTQVLQRVGWNKLERTEKSVYLPHVGMEIDFGGFGKEYAADCAARILLDQGIHNGIVDLGGDIRILGPQLDGQPWQIGIQDPRQNNKIIASIPMLSGALATSGDYERFIEVNGQRYCHILNPRSGYPVQYWQSVSVVAPAAIAAGSYATITMLREEQGEAWLRDSDLAFLLIDANGDLRRRDAALV